MLEFKSWLFNEESRFDNRCGMRGDLEWHYCDEIVHDDDMTLFTLDGTGHRRDVKWNDCAHVKFGKLQPICRSQWDNDVACRRDLFHEGFHTPPWLKRSVATTIEDPYDY